ncbi:MAG: DUF1343 domain-containing protein [Bacteroidia bacterium]
MNKLIVLTSCVILFLCCSSFNEQQQSSSISDAKLVLGAERTAEYLPLLKDKKVALMVNQTSTIGATHLVDSLLALGIDLVTVFAPEHGFRGEYSDGATVHGGIDEQTGVKITSLYGKNKRMQPQMLEGIDVLLFDIQDVGVRFYTFISSMHYAMQACAKSGKRFIVLDRPNPNGFYVDGPVLDLKYQSFIGVHPIPVVHGLTVGELAQMINGESWLGEDLRCELTVVSCLNYSHDILYQLPIRPSPNLPNMNSVYLYPFLGLFEGTNVSVGRGTETPFQILGRPGFKGVEYFTPQSLPGVSDKPKHMGELCGGIVITDAVDSSLFENPRLNLSYLLLFSETNNEEVNGSFFRSYINKLIGNEEFKLQIARGETEDEIRASWSPKLEQYKELRKLYLLYP